MDMRSSLRALRLHWVGVVILTLVGVGLAAGWTIMQKPVYTADVTGYVAASVTNNDTGSALMADNLAKAKVTSYLDLGRWRSVADFAITKLGLSDTPESVVQRISVTNPINTVNIKVSAQAGSPEAARDLAEAWLAGMAAEVKALESGSSSDDGVVRLVPGDSAQLPTSPSSPNVRLNLALGGVAGFAAGLLYAFLRHRFDRRIRSADAVEDETGHAVIGTIPFEKTLTPEQRLLPFDGAASSGKLFAIAEAIRELRTNIQYVDVDNPLRTLVVTSPLPGDGKSTTSANLAVAMAAAGQRVYLIDGDLRRPMVGTTFGLPEGAGLTDILAQRASVDDVAQLVPGTGQLYVIAAGRVPPNPSELLGSGRMETLLTTLGREAMVIVDAPPLLAVTDAAILATRTAGAIVVVSAGRTTYDVLRKAIGTLDRVGARTLGIVVNRTPRRGGGYYDYRYDGGYYAAAADAPVADVPVAAEAVDVALPPEPQPTGEGGDAVANAGALRRRDSRRERRAVGS